MTALTIAKISAEPYRLPLGGPTAQAAGSALREGLVIRVVLMDGMSALGDAAPLPGQSAETLGQTREAVEYAAEALRGTHFASLDEIAALLDPLHLPSAARHGIEQALLFALAAARRKPPAILLGAADLPAQIWTNALVQTEQDATHAVAAGYLHLKLKVARDPLSADLKRIASVRAAVGPKVEIRLDANGRWSEDVARVALAELESFDIAYVEQPVAQLPTLAALRREQHIPLAADELCRSPADARTIIKNKAADLLVIKPMLCGGLFAAREIAHLATAAGLDVVVTSSLESAVGCEAALQLVAALPAPHRAAGLISSDPRWSQGPRISVFETAGKRRGA